MPRIASDRRAVAIDERAVVLDQAFQRLPAQVETVECRIAALQVGHDTQRLRVVIKTSASGQTLIESTLDRMVVRRTGERVLKRQGFREVLVQTKCVRERTGDLADLQSVGQS